MSEVDNSRMSLHVRNEDAALSEGFKNLETLGSAKTPVNEDVCRTLDDLIENSSLNMDDLEMPFGASVKDYDSSSMDSDLPDLPSYNELFPADSTSLELDYEFLKKECEKPCWVVLERLKKEDIEKNLYLNVNYMSDFDRSMSGEDTSQNSVKRSRRFVKDFAKYEEYKKNRQNFLQKKKRVISTDSEAYYGSSNEEYQPPPEYFNKESKKRKKKFTYEDDVEWSPGLERDVNLFLKHPKHKKSDKLRITTRRRRIETDSDSDSDFDFENYMYNYDEDSDNQEKLEKSTAALNAINSKEIYDTSSSTKPPPKRKPPRKKVPKTDEKNSINSENTMIDNDVLSQIMQEMEDYKINSKGSKVVRSIYNGATTQQSIPKIETKNSFPGRKRVGIKVTKNILPPNVCTVQKLLSKMVNTVCGIENSRLEEILNSKKKKCKWCNELFNSENSKDILCVICKDTVSAPSATGLPNKKKSKYKKESTKVTSSARNKIKNKIMKNLPKYDQQLLAYTDKAASDKKYTHCKSSDTLNNMDHSDVGEDALNLEAKGKKRKRKKSDTNKSKEDEENITKPPKKTKKQQKSDLETRKAKAKNASNNSNNVSVTNVDKGLFLMTFPDPDKELEIPPSPFSVKNFNSTSLTITQSNSVVSTSGSSTPTVSAKPSSQSANNTSYGSYLMPSVPTVVVANYSASNTNNGEYVLSNVYYQNELTKNSKVNKNTSSVAHVSNALNMPKSSELTLVKQTIPPNAHQNVYLPQPPSVSIRPVLNNSNNPLTINSNSNLIRSLQSHATTVQRPPQSALPPNILNSLQSQVTSMQRPIQNALPPNILANMQPSVVNNYTLDPYVKGLIKGGLQISSTSNNSLTLNPNNPLNVNPNSSITVNPINSFNINPNNSLTVNPINSININPNNSLTVNPLNSININPNNSLNINPNNSLNINPNNTLNINPINLNSTLNINPNTSLTMNPSLANLTLGNDSNYSMDTDITRLINNCGLQITPAADGNLPFQNTMNDNLTSLTDYPSESDVNSIINNYDIPFPDQSQLLLDNNNQNPNFSFNNQNTTFSDIPYIGSNTIENQTSAQIDTYNININSHISNITQETSATVEGTSADNNEQHISDNNKKQNLPKTDDNHLEKEYRELEALSILSIMDLEKNPKSALLLKIEHNNKQIEELSKDKSKNSEYLAALNSREVYKIAKKWLVRFGSFTRLSEHFLKTEETQSLKTPLQIKKEHIEEGEEEMPSCQFAEKSRQSATSELVSALTVKQVSLNPSDMSSESLPIVNHIASLETQVDSIADQLNAAGVDCTIPIPGIAAMSAGNCLIPPNITRTDLLQDSRETPSRGSGPRTPARPESAASHNDDRMMMTPAQIKRERMESASSPFSQCAYSGTSQLPYSTNASQVISPSVSQSMAALSSLLSPSLSRVQTNLPQPIVSQSDMSQLDMALRNSSVIPRQVTTVAPNVSLIPNVSYTNQAPNFNVRNLPQNVSTQLTNALNSPRYTSGTNVPTAAVNCNALVPYNPQIQNTINYQNQIPPNRTIPYPNISKVVMNLVSQSQNVNPNVSSNSQNSNMVFRNAQQGQLYIQQQQQQQPVNQVYNVQQVYLPNKSPLLQQSLVGQQQITSQSNSISLQQNTDNGALLLNSVSMAGNNMQQSNPYSIANNIVSNYPQGQITQPMNTPASVQQVASPSGAATAYLMQNNNNKLSVTATEENITDMFCAMCNKVASLRCKQCAKVAYCNPTCAKTYWHTKHKMECRPLNNTV